MKILFRVEKTIEGLKTPKPKIEIIYAEKVKDEIVYFGGCTKGIYAVMFPKHEYWSSPYHQYFWKWEDARTYIKGAIESTMKSLEEALNKLKKDHETILSLQKLTRLKG